MRKSEENQRSLRDRLGSYVSTITNQLIIAAVVTLLVVPLTYWSIDMAMDSLRKDDDPVVDLLPKKHFVWGYFSVPDRYPLGAGMRLAENDYVYFLDQTVDSGHRSDIWHTSFKVKSSDFSHVRNGWYIVEFVFFSTQERATSITKRAQVRYGAVIVELRSPEERRNLKELIARWTSFMVEIDDEGMLARSQRFPLDGSALAVKSTQRVCEVVLLYK